MIPRELLAKNLTYMSSVCSVALKNWTKEEVGQKVSESMWRMWFHCIGVEVQWVRGAVPGKGQGSWRSLMNIAMKEETFFVFLFLC